MPRATSLAAALLATAPSLLASQAPAAVEPEILWSHDTGG